MKTYLPYSLIFAAAASGMAFGAVTAYTTPVGYVGLGNTTPGANNVPNNTDVSISIPLMRADEYAGTVASVTGNQVFLSGTPAFTVNQWTAVPYYFVIKSGAKNGLVALISSNQAGNVTITPQPGETLAGVIAGDKISISKAWTVSSFFAGNTLPDGVELFAFSGTTPGINIANDLGYTLFGTWFDSTTFAAADNVVLYPGESFVLRNTSGTAIADLVVSGTVPVQRNFVEISKLAGPGTGQDNRVGYVGPVGEVIGTSGLGFTDGDELLFPNNIATGLNKAPSSVVFFGGAWFDSTTFADVTATFTLDGGVGYVYRRVNTAAVGDVTWIDQQTYIPSL